MIYHFRQIKGNLKETYDAILNDLNLDNFDEAENLERALNDIENSLRQLYETKKGAKYELTDMSKSILRCSQGYQLSSEMIKSKKDLWKSRIRKLEIHSGITKDQINYGVEFLEDEVERNMNYFLQCFKNVEFITNTFEVPKELNLRIKEVDVESYSIHKKKNGDFINTPSYLKTLRIVQK